MLTQAAGRRRGPEYRIESKNGTQKFLLRLEIVKNFNKHNSTP